MVQKLEERTDKNNVKKTDDMTSESNQRRPKPQKAILMMFDMQVEDNTVSVVYHRKPDTTSFIGQKLNHPFVMTKEGKGFFYTDELARDLSSTRFFVKFDGSCGQIDKSVAKRRFDCRFNPKTSDWKDLPFRDTQNYVRCSDEPEKLAANHWPFMRNLAPHVKPFTALGDLWFNDAMTKFKKSSLYDGESVVYGEWMGPKINHNPTDPLEENFFIPYNMVEFVIPPKIRNYAGIEEIFKRVPTIEGLVGYSESGEIYKIRRSMFHGLNWPPATSHVGIDLALVDFLRLHNAKGFSDYIVKSSTQ